MWPRLHRHLRCAGRREWVGVATALGPGTAPASGPADRRRDADSSPVVGTPSPTCSCTGRAHSWPHGQRSPNRSAWQDHASNQPSSICGVPCPRRSGPRPDRRGRHGQTPRDRIRVGHPPRRGAQVQPDPRTRQPAGTAGSSRPTRTPTPSSGQATANTSITEPIELGVFEDGTPVTVSLNRRHGLVGGVAGAGTERRT